MPYANRHVLVETDWLEAHLGDADLRVIDCRIDMLAAEGQAHGLRFVPAAAAWKAAHVPGATFVDFTQDLSDHDHPLQFMLPPANQFANVMSRHGVGEGTRVVLYDGFMNMWAARLWWMLRAYGFDEAAVLNGGWHKWTAEGRRTSSEAPAPRPTTFTVKQRRNCFVGSQDVLRGIGEPGTCLVDAMTPEHYTGHTSFYGRPGHIASAVNVPFVSVVDPETHAYLAPAPLRARLESVGATTAARVVTYCGGGIAASSAAFALALLGHDDVAIYDGSLSEWTTDPSLPMETGSRVAAR
jgi:thiosulfate/3-mercaptopyruvate sulfurtransferase